MKQITTMIALLLLSGCFREVPYKTGTPLRALADRACIGKGGVYKYHYRDFDSNTPTGNVLCYYKKQEINLFELPPIPEGEK